MCAVSFIHTSLSLCFFQVNDSTAPHRTRDPDNPCKGGHGTTQPEGRSVGRARRAPGGREGRSVAAVVCALCATRVGD